MAKRRDTGMPRELELSDELCLAFANTAAGRRDDRFRAGPPPSPGLDDYGALLAWSQRMGVVPPPDAQRLARLAAERPAEAAAIHARAMGMRAAIGRIFTVIAERELPSPQDLATLNATLAELPPRILVPEADGWSLAFAESGNALPPQETELAARLSGPAPPHSNAGSADLLARPLWSISLSAAELLISADREWVRQCADPQCPRLFVDRRSRRRRWCDPNTCGSRARGKRFYRRGGRVRV